VTAAGAELVRLARQVGLVKGEWVAIDGSKFRAVSSADRVGEREAVKRYLEQLESADQQDEVSIDDTAVAAAMEKLKNDPEPEARFMRMAQNAHAPAYNVQTAVDATHGIIVAQQVTTEANDNRSLLPMARAAKEALGAPESLNVIADAGYSNGEQAAQCETHGIVPHVPANRTDNKGDGTLFDRTLFVYDEKTDTFRCPANQTLHRKQMLSRKKSVIYAADEKTCSLCPLKSQCTSTTRRFVQRHIHDAALQRMDARATAQAMRLRQCTVERPFALLKWVIFGHPRFLLRGVSGAQVEISLATMAYNLKTMMHVVGGSKLNNILTA
jgi:DDE family transposase